MLKIFGRDYDTIDGTGVRDFIHITDLGKKLINCSESPYKGLLKIIKYAIGEGINI